MERQPQTELLFIIPNLEFGGSEKMLVNLVNRMDQALFNIQVVSLGLDNPFASQIQPEVAKVHFFPRLWRYDLGPASQIRKLILESQIDTVVGFDFAQAENIPTNSQFPCQNLKASHSKYCLRPLAFRDGKNHLRL
jgi:hypothetical protein